MASHQTKIQNVCGKQIQEIELTCACLTMIGTGRLGHLIAGGGLSQCQIIKI